MEAPLILAVETSGRQGSVALFKGHTLAQFSFSFKVKSYSGVIFPYLKRVLETTQVSLNQVDYYAVDIGPGSFTGLRISCSLIKALCLSCERPIITLSSLEALAWLFPTSPYPLVSLVDAYTKEVFLAVYKWKEDNLFQVIEPTCMPFKDLPLLVEEPSLFLSETPEKWEKFLREKLRDVAIFPPYTPELSASHIARISWYKLKKGQASFEKADTLLPLYLKASEAERKRKC
jgi:tRNA threonylcarbamoyladenosine biosynthesis protein TsaB